MSLRVLDLFSGIGGFSLGLERAGMRTVAFCEIDPYCRAVLRKHWPAVPCFSDVRDLHAFDVGPVDLICGGFPCQDISTAGRGAGLAGARSGLWSEYRRLIEECRPAWVVIENVSALRSRGLDQVLGELAALGYDAEWHCIPAAAVGAPHRRDRVWIIAYPVSVELRQQPGRRSGTSGADTTQLAEHGAVGLVADAYLDARLARRLGDAIESTRGRDAGGSGLNSDVADADSERGCLRHAEREDARQSPRRARSRSWDVEPDVGRVANGVPFELDIIGRLNESADDPQAVAASQIAIRRVLLYVWEHQGLAATSPDLYRRGLCDCVPEVPHQNPYGGWLLGPRLQEDQGLRNLWEAVCSKPQQETQDVQRELLERAGQKKRPKALGSRVDRLRALGNAVVPQIPEIIGRAILEAERTR